MTRRLIRVKLVLILALFSVAAIAGCTGDEGGTTTSAPTTTAAPTTTPEPTTSKPPIAEAGDDQTVEAGNTVTYDASGSSDPSGGSIVDYEWKVVGAPSGKEDTIGNVIYSGSDAKWTTSWSMKSGDVGQWTMELKVTNDKGDTAVDRIVLTVTEAATDTGDDDLLLDDEGS